MNRRDIALGAASTLLLAGVLLAVGMTVSAAFGRGSTRSLRTSISLDVSWAHAYGSIAGLKSSADLVVLGTIESSQPATPVRGQDPNALSVPMTDFRFDVEQVVSDPHHLAPLSAVTVHQTGGMLEGQLAQVDDDPLFQIGERCVLFLHEYSPRHYFVIGGPQGRFEVLGSAVDAASVDHIPGFQTTDLASFLSLIERT